jgi:hypothetical protein
LSLCVAVAAGCFALDRATKRAASGRPRRLRFSHGPHVLAAPLPERLAVPLLLVLFAAALAGLVIAPSPSPAAAAALTGAAFGGAVSNLLDGRRAGRGYDFLPLAPGVVVNVADIAIVAGLVGRLALLAV